MPVQGTNHDHTSTYLGAAVCRVQSKNAKPEIAAESCSLTPDKPFAGLLLGGIELESVTRVINLAPATRRFLSDVFRTSTCYRRGVIEC